MNILDVNIDDYGYWPGCAKAIEDYRKEHNITEEWIWEDQEAIHWKKMRDVSSSLAEY